MNTKINVHPFRFQYITIHFGWSNTFWIVRLYLHVYTAPRAFPLVHNWYRWRALSSIENYSRIDFLCVKLSALLLAFAFIPQLFLSSFSPLLYIYVYTISNIFSVILCDNENQMCIEKTMSIDIDVGPFCASDPYFVFLLFLWLDIQCWNDCRFKSAWYALHPART